MRKIAWIACCAAMLGAVPAYAVELKTLTAQVNPKADPDLSLFQPTLTAGGSGGFAVVWGKISVETRTSEVHARFYTKKAKPDGGPIRVDGPVEDRRPTSSSRIGAAALGGDKTLATWSASGFADGGPSEGVGRFLEDGKTVGKTKSLEKEPQVSWASTVELPGGRAILSWSTPDTPFRLVGRLVEPDGKLKKPNLDLSISGSSSRPVLYPLGDGAIGVAFRTVVGSQVEVVGQIFDTDGKRRGGVIVLMEASDRPSYAAVPIALPDGGFALLDCFPPAGASLCDVTAQRFTKKGKKSGSPKVLVAGAENQSIEAVSLGGAGLLLALEEYDSERLSRIVYRRINGDLKKAGSSASTNWLFGQRRGPMKQLSNGDVAAVIAVNNGDLFVQTLKP